MKWISKKEKLPNEGQIVEVKYLILFRSKGSALYTKKYFIRIGEDITKWVTHWRPLSESKRCDFNKMEKE